MKKDYFVASKENFQKKLSKVLLRGKILRLKNYFLEEISGRNKKILEFHFNLESFKYNQWQEVL